MLGYECAKKLARREFRKGEKIATLKGITSPISLEQGKILGDCGVDTSCTLNFILQEVSTPRFHYKVPEVLVDCCWSDTLHQTQTLSLSSSPNIFSFDFILFLLRWQSIFLLQKFSSSSFSLHLARDWLWPGLSVIFISVLLNSINNMCGNVSFISSFQEECNS